MAQRWILDLRDAALTHVSSAAWSGAGGLGERLSTVPWLVQLGPSPLFAGVVSQLC